MSTGSWDDRAVETANVKLLQGGEFKSFNVECQAGHATAFVVIVEQETEVWIVYWLLVLYSIS